MKKFFLAIITVMLLSFATANTATAQNFSLNASTGLSWFDNYPDFEIKDWISGRLGVELIFRDYVGIGAGWKPTQYPVSLDKINDNFCFQLTGYTPRVFKTARLYGTVGYNTKGYRYEEYGAEGVFYQATSGVYVAVMGIKLQYKDFPLYVKGCYGYGKCFEYDISTSTYELVIGTRLFKF